MLFKYVKGSKPVIKKNHNIIKQVQSEELFRIKWNMPQWYFGVLAHFCLPFRL